MLAANAKHLLETKLSKHALTALTLVCATLTGCAPRYADVPAPTRFANEQQQQLQAARHWQLIADHFADQIAISLQDKLKGRAIHVPQPEGEQAFVEGFRDLLISSLLNRGVPVATSPAKALTVDVRYNVYRFRPERVASTYYYGQASALAAGLWAVGSIMVADLATARGLSYGLKAMTGIGAAEGFSWIQNEGMQGGRFTNDAVPRSEIILSVGISDGDRLISRQSNIYYTTDQDFGLYWKRTPGSGNVIKVYGDCSSGETKCAR